MPSVSVIFCLLKLLHFLDTNKRLQCFVVTMNYWCLFGGGFL